MCGLIYLIRRKVDSTSELGNLGMTLGENPAFFAIWIIWNEVLFYRDVFRWLAADQGALTLGW